MPLARNKVPPAASVKEALGFRFQRVQDLCVRTLGFGRPRPYKGRAEWFERMLSLCTIARLRGCAPIQLPMPG